MADLVLVFQVHDHVVSAGQRPLEHASVRRGDLDWRLDVAHLLQHGAGRLLNAINELDHELVRNPLVVLVQVHAVVEEDVRCNTTQGHVTQSTSHYDVIINHKL